MLKKARSIMALVWVGCLWLLAGAAVAATTIDSAQLSTDLKRTHLVLDLSGPVDYDTLVLSKPDRVVIDLSDSRMRADLDKLSLRDSPIKRVRSGIRKGVDVRLVLDLSETVTAQTSLIKAGNGNRLVIDLYRSAGAGKSQVVAAAKPAVPVKTASTGGQRDIVIAIDAGHGGKDSGAVGPGHLQEKQVAIAIAKEVGALFERQRGYRPVLTRKGDYFLPLKTRRDLARKAQADLMLSIHADAFTDSSARGGSVFALSNRGATSTMAAFLAASENEADAIGGVPIEGKDDDLVKVLADLSLTATMDASMRIGRDVLHSMGGVTRLHAHRVEQAAFVVLKSPDTPSILVETGFISNPVEAKRLASRSYQQQLAKAIFDGVTRYFSQSPPPNTYVAWVKRNSTQQAALATSARDDALAAVH